MKFYEFIKLYKSFSVVHHDSIAVAVCNDYDDTGKAPVYHTWNMVDPKSELCEAFYDYDIKAITQIHLQKVNGDPVGIVLEKGV